MANDQTAPIDDIERTARALTGPQHRVLGQVVMQGTKGVLATGGRDDHIADRLRQRGLLDFHYAGPGDLPLWKATPTGRLVAEVCRVANCSCKKVKEVRRAHR